MPKFGSVQKIKKHRRFNGKRFTMTYKTTHKYQVENKVRKLKKKGLLYRIIKHRGYGIDGIFLVYTRKK